MEHGSLKTIYKEFYDLVKPTPVRKKRKCLRCHTTFTSSGAGHRLCAQCSNARSTESVLFK